MRRITWRHCVECGAALVRERYQDGVRFRCGSCAGEYYENPVPVVCGMGFRDGRLLLIRRGVEPCAGRWALPGGFVAMGELPEAAIVREFREETGLEARAVELLGIHGERGSRYPWILTLVYRMELDEGEPYAGDDAQEARFFSRGEVPEIPFESHREAVDAYFS